MVPRSKTEQWTFKRIVLAGDNWERYQRAYAGQVLSEQLAEVEKMMGCRKPRNGYATYICLNCGETKKVPFSCKSRVCSSCGKVAAEEWSKEVTSRMFSVVHRHVTFTVPNELWSEFERQVEWRGVLFEAANATLRKVMKVEPGIVAVLHPYGKDLKANYHIHVLVTEGGLDEAGRWQEKSFLSFKALRKVWQYEVLTRLREVMPAGSRTKGLIGRLFRQYKNGFYVHAAPRVKNGKGISRYIGRYIRHPAIADTRIVDYDGEQVTFYYQDHGGKRHEKVMPVLDFIHGVVRHIAPKNFKMVRYYGLYAPRKASAMRELLKEIGKVVGRVIGRLSWRARIERDFQRDPLTCPRCGSHDMELLSLTFHKCGQLMTIGGIDWLLDRGAIIVPQANAHSVPARSLSVQLAMPL
jgi:hypothetical protein